MKIIVTGATGFVGKNLIPYLIKNITESEIIPLSIRYGDSITTCANIYIHLAGKAHDTMNISEDSIYYEANYLLTKSLFDKFLEDEDASCFIYMSSIKAIAENPRNVLVNEDYREDIISIYGRSKRMAEEYILSRLTSKKRVFILRPCMIHGPGNKGNFNLLYKFISTGFPWPFASFNATRSFCSIQNLCFVIEQLIISDKLSSTTLNIADNLPIETNNLIRQIGDSLNRDVIFLYLPRVLIRVIARIGDYLNFAFNSKSLAKLTEDFIVDSSRMQVLLGKQLPVDSVDGINTTLKSFKM
ncbi:MAG: NAD-dependent epimerase/dehydratase family protein [Hydrotalea sp.]|nr:NAD-dependent epimerase/dehydratase family protein [Hydrotalea sp.]